MDVFEAMESCRAIRHLKPDPVPEDAIRKVVHAATRASNPGNSQGWSFVVVRDALTRARFGKALREALLPVIEGMASQEATASGQRMYAGVTHLLEHYESVPVWIFLCGEAVYPPAAPSRAAVLAGIYPAAQNLIVAARALGLGTTFTTFHESIAAVVREGLALPEEVQLGVAIAMGWPEKSFGPVKRKPLDEVLHWERW